VAAGRQQIVKQRQIEESIIIKSEETTGSLFPASIPSIQTGVERGKGWLPEEDALI